MKQVDGQWTPLEEQDMISEVPWISFGDETIDLELEKIKDPDEALRKIRGIINALPPEKRFAFKKDLMNNYRKFLENRFGISFQDLGTSPFQELIMFRCDSCKKRVDTIATVKTRFEKRNLCYKCFKDEVTNGKEKASEKA